MSSSSKKNIHAQELGRLGGLKGGKARAESLTKERRSEIAKLAAQKRWAKKPEDKKQMATWSKTLTDSDAQQDTEGSKMPFLRFTKAGHHIDYFTYFRDDFFSNLDWVATSDDPLIEEANISIDVTILGNRLGTKNMTVDHKPSRAENHSAPTTHLHYDHATRYELENSSLTGCIVELRNNNGQYSFEVYDPDE